MDDLYFKPSPRARGIREPAGSAPPVPSPPPSPAKVRPPTLRCECGRVTDGHPYGCLRCRRIDGDTDHAYDIIRGLRVVGPMTAVEIGVLCNRTRTWAVHKMAQLVERGFVVRRVRPGEDGAPPSVFWSLA